MYRNESKTCRCDLTTLRLSHVLMSPDVIIHYMNYDKH